MFFSSRSTVSSTSNAESFLSNSMSTVSKIVRGPKYIVSGLITFFTPGSAFKSFLMLSSISGSAPSPTKKTFAFVNQKTGDRAENYADQNRSRAVQIRIVKIMRQKNADKGDDQTEHRGGIFKQNGKSRRVFAGFDRLPDIFFFFFKCLEIP